MVQSVLKYIFDFEIFLFEALKFFSEIVEKSSKSFEKKFKIKIFYNKCKNKYLNNY